ncbi:MAG: gliding motility-associated C-terminal domain-containing protein [Bacteroidota bacterium]
MKLHLTTQLGSIWWLLTFLTTSSYAQDSLRLSWQLTTDCPTNTVSAILQTEREVSLNGLQMTIDWDTTALAYLDFQSYQLNNPVFGEDETDKGFSGFIWTNTGGQRLTTNDTLVQLIFRLKKCTVEDSQISILNDPVAIKAVQLSPTFEIVELEVIEEPAQITGQPCSFIELLIDQDLLCPRDSATLMIPNGVISSWSDTSATLFRRDPSTVIARPKTTTEYAFILNDVCGEDTSTVTLEVLSNNVTAGMDTCIGFGSTISLNAQNALIYQWQPSDFPVSNPTIANPTVSPEKTTFYVLEALDSNDCQIVDSVGVFVSDNPQLAIEKINFLTPNDDGFNDVLEFKNLEKFRTNSLKVYNRQGVPVYERVDYQKNEERWRGQFRNTNLPLPAGVYFYVLRVNDSEIKQTLNLLR